MVAPVRWPYLYTQATDLVLVAVAKDGTKLSTSQSPLVQMPSPAVDQAGLL